MRAGSGMVLVLMVLSVFTVLATIVVAQAGYSRRMAYDRLWAEQRRAAAQALLGYAVSWVRENRALLVSDHEKAQKDEKSVEPWYLQFDSVPISHRLSGAATIDVQTQGNLDILCNIRLHDGITEFSRASCTVALGDADKPAIIREWAVHLGA